MGKKIHAMIDLETLDTTPYGQILTIGGVKFNPYSFDEPFADFYYRFDIDEQEKLGRTQSESTLEWWGNQSDKVIEAAFGEDLDRHDVETIIKDMRKWYVGCDAVWAQGVAFDIPMLEDAARNVNLTVPWPFWKVKDSRTLFGLLDKDPRKEFKFDAHDALEDARIQAKCVQITYNKLGLF